MFKIIRALAGLAAVLGTLQAQAGDIEVSLPQPAVAVAAGTVAMLPIHLHNADSLPSEATRVSIFYVPVAWTSVTSGAGCGAVQPVGETGTVAEFDSPSLPPGGSLDCILAVTRPADSIDDIHLTVQTYVDFNAHRASVVLGTLADIELRNSRVSYSIAPDGTTHSVFRLTARNVGNVSVGAFNAMTCSRQNSFDNTISGGCAPTTSECALQQIPYPAQGALIPALAPGESFSCLLAVTGSSQFPHVDELTLDQDPSWNIWLIDALTGGTVYDGNTADNTTLLLAPPGNPAGTAVAAPTSSPWALAMLALGLSGLAGAAARRADLRRRSTS